MRRPPFWSSMAVLGASLGLLTFASTFAGCSGSSSTPPPGPADATAQDGSSLDDAASMEDAPSEPVEASVDAGATPDAGVDAALDAAADASDGSARDGSSDGGAEAAAACIPIDAGTPDAAAIAAGQALTTSFTPNCNACHGTDFSGGMQITGATSKNLTPDPTGLGCWTDSQIVTAILNGTTPDGTTLCVMPKWSTKGMTPDQAEEIVHYLRSLPAVSKVVPASGCEIPADAGGGDAGDAGDAGH
jgi:mono/diheme cytochrome c family protein